MAFYYSPDDEDELSFALHESLVTITADDVLLDAELATHPDAREAVLLADASACSRDNRAMSFIAEAFQEIGLATLQVDLFTEDEVAVAQPGDEQIALLARRLAQVIAWLHADRRTAALKLGYFGQGAGAAATAKHFPGHGDTDTDSHLALPVVKSDRRRLDRVELVPFRAAIAAGVMGVMSAHIALPAIGNDSTPATLRPEIITGLLRDTLGFTGVTFTDALSMEGIGAGFTVEKSAVMAVKAGNDVLLKPTDVRRAIDAVVAAVERAAGELRAAVSRVHPIGLRTS